MIAVDMNDHGFTARITAAAAQVRNPAGLMRVLGREGANRLKAHFLKKERTEPNKLGGQRTHFWRKVAQAVQSPVVGGDGKSVVVSINHPAFAQKVFGGTIRAKRAGALTIPVSPEAHGRTARTFEAETGLKLFLMKSGKGSFQGAMLAAARGKGFTIEYILTPEVQQDPDPTALPEADALRAALIARADAYVARQLQANSAPPTSA